MSTIFLSYHRTDGPQACRIYDSLTRRFGHDTVFMDVANIPLSVSFPAYVQEAISGSSILLALVGADWLHRITLPEDYVRKELESALEGKVPVLPLLIGDVQMPRASDLPARVQAIATTNAIRIGALHDFAVGMKLLVTHLESQLSARSVWGATFTDRHLITRTLNLIGQHFQHKAIAERSFDFDLQVEFRVVSSAEIQDAERFAVNTCTLHLHRISRLADELELHVLFSFWAQAATVEQVLAFWVMNELDSLPVLSADMGVREYDLSNNGPGIIVKNPDGILANDATKLLLSIRRSDEDPRQIWKLVTDIPFRLSVAYIASIMQRQPFSTSAPR